GNRRSTPHDREVFVRQPLRVKSILTRPRPCLIIPAKRLPSDNLGVYGRASVMKRRYGRGSGTAQGRFGCLPGGGARLLYETAAEATRSLLVALVAGGCRGHLGRLLWVEPGVERRGLRWTLDRDHLHRGDVLRTLFQHRRDVSRPAAHGRSLFV